MKKSTAGYYAALMQGEWVTPMGRKYRLKEIENQGRNKRLFIYTWLDCPAKVAEGLTTLNMAFKHDVDASIIDTAISAKIKLSRAVLAGEFE